MHACIIVAYLCFRIREFYMLMKLYACHCNDLFLKHVNLVIGFIVMHMILVEYFEDVVK